MTTDSTDQWNKWFRRAVQLSALVIVFLIVLRHLTLDPYLYPILALMLGFPIAGWAEGLLRKGNGGNGNGKV